MTFVLLSLSHFLHLASTVIWIGGITIILFVTLPAAQHALGTANLTGAMMKEVGRRFTPLANISIVLMFISGMIIWYSGNSRTDHDYFRSALIIKHVLVVSMVFIHLYRMLVLGKRVASLSAQGSDRNGVQDEISRLNRLSLNLVKANFYLGMVVLLLTSLILSLPASK